MRGIVKDDHILESFPKKGGINDMFGFDALAGFGPNLVAASGWASWQ
jgi:hypothetical protein